MPSVAPAITLGTGVVSLGVIHDFAAENVPVIHVSTKSSDIALRSRYPREKLIATGGGKRVVDLLLEHADAWRGAYLVPTVDPLLAQISKRLDELTPYYRTTVMPWNELEPIVDKSRLYETAHAIGVPAPSVLPVSNVADVTAWAARVGYPVIVKPKQAPAFFRVFNRKALEAYDEHELLSVLEAALAKNLDVMVSEIIPGTVTNLCCYRAYVNRHGRVAAEMCSQKVRSHPPEYGVGRVQKTIPMIEALRDTGRKLLQRLGFRGYASMEFKRDSRDGIFKLIEINPRPALCQQLFRSAGMNFSYLGDLDAHGLPLPELRYDPDVYVIHNADELYYVRGYLHKGLGGVRELLAPYRQKRRAFMIPARKDPMPLFYQLGRMAKSALRRRGLAPRQTGGETGDSE